MGLLAKLTLTGCTGSSMFASNQNCGYSCCRQAPESTGNLKGPERGLTEPVVKFGPYILDINKEQVIALTKKAKF